MVDTRPYITLTGATGYVGSLLIEPLCAVASEVRCISRNPNRIATRLPANATAVRADITDLDSARRALAGSDIAFYLVHSLGESKDFAEVEARSARMFAQAASDAGVKRIIFLGALAPGGAEQTSEHIRSRHEVGRLLNSTGVPVTEFRASVVIGSGSMPFEAMRALVQRLPVMVTPRWVRMPVQPIYHGDLVKYLVAAVQQEGGESHIYEIGGANVTDYAELMREYARQRGLRRYMVPVPVITPRLSSLWLRLITPTHYRIGKNIVDSTTHGSVVTDSSAREDFDVSPVTFEEAIALSLAGEDRELSFLDRSEDTEALFERLKVGTKFVERRRVRVMAGSDEAFDVVSHVGGESGWFWGDWLWRIRGALDRLAGGPGLRKKLTQFPPVAGGLLDFWIVERVTDDRLTLRADMRLPGRAWLDFAVRSRNGETFIEQTAAFDPRGLFGMFYWYAMYPMHRVVFSRMLEGARQRVEDRARIART